MGAKTARRGGGWLLLFLLLSGCDAQAQPAVAAPSPASGPASAPAPSSAGATAQGSTTTAPVPAVAASHKLVLWNTHNGSSRDRGAKFCNVRLIRGKQTVAILRDIRLEYEPLGDSATTIPLPAAAFDRVRVEVTSWIGACAGLAEVELIAGRRNLALNASTKASAIFDPRFASNAVTDGNRSSEEMAKGYWLAPDWRPAWVEVLLPSEVKTTGAPAQVDDREYVGDLVPTQVEKIDQNGWELAPKGGFGSFGAHRISVGGVDSPNGIGIHPGNNGGTLAYSLGGRYTRFSGATAINDGSGGSLSQVVFSVVCDNKEVWRSRPLQREGDKQAFDLDVSGVDEIRLVARCSGPFTGAHTVWIEPVLRVGRVEPGSILAGRSGAAPDAATSPAAVTSAAPPETPGDDPDAIERPEFRDQVKTITRLQASIKAMNVGVAPDGQLLGDVDDLIAIAPVDGRSRGDNTVRFVRGGGPEMQTSLQEAMRAVQLRYPRWDGRIELSFGHKYQEQEGGSAGAAFTVLLFSILEGFEIDPGAAITGDVTVDWKVRSVGGIGAKLRGAAADHCVVTAIPAGNADAAADAAVLDGDSVLWDTQIFAIASIQEAVAVTRKDRRPDLAAAIKEFGALQADFKKRGKAALTSPETRAALQAILKKAPNHLSARLLLQTTKGEFPQQLSLPSALQEIFLAVYPLREALWGTQVPDRAHFTPSMAASARKRAQKLRDIVPKELQPVLIDLQAFINIAERVTTGVAGPEALKTQREALLSKFEDLSANRAVLEKLLREGS